MTNKANNDIMFDSKPFNQKTYDENDVECRRVFYDWAHKRGFFIIDGNSLDKFGTDAIIGYYSDFERRPSWIGKTFPFKTIHIPYRKKHLIENRQFKYIVFNRDRNYILICNGKHILSSKVISIATKEGTENERFFDVPIKYFKLIKMEA